MVMVMVMVTVTVTVTVMVMVMVIISHLTDKRIDGRKWFSALSQVAVAVVASEEEELERSNSLDHRHAEVPSFNLWLGIADHAHHLMKET